MKKFSKARLHYKKHERRVMARQSRRAAKSTVRLTASMSCVCPAGRGTDGVGCVALVGAMDS